MGAQAFSGSASVGLKGALLDSSFDIAMVQFRMKSKTLSCMMLCAVALLVWSFPAPSCFVQKPQQVQAVPGAAGILGAAAAMAPTAAFAAYDWPGPLDGTAACNKPLFYLVAPLCNGIFWISPIYAAPALFVIITTFITIVQLLIPATQPDEDLR